MPPKKPVVVVAATPAAGAGAAEAVLAKVLPASVSSTSRVSLALMLLLVVCLALVARAAYLRAVSRSQQTLRDGGRGNAQAAETAIEEVPVMAPGSTSAAAVSSQPMLILFYATWCSACTKFKPIWNAQLSPGGGGDKPVGGAPDADTPTSFTTSSNVNMRVVAVDCSELSKSTQVATQWAKQYDVNVLPTVILVQPDGSTYRMDSPASAASLAKLLRRKQPSSSSSTYASGTQSIFHSSAAELCRPHISTLL